MKTKQRLITVCPQKDGRTILGTAVHAFHDCPNLSKTKSIVLDIVGSPVLVNTIKKCSWCFERIKQ